MTDGLIDTPSYYKKWTGGNAIKRKWVKGPWPHRIVKDTRKVTVPNSYACEISRITRPNDVPHYIYKAKDYIVGPVIAYPAMDKDMRLARNSCIMQIREKVGTMDLWPMLKELNGTAETMVNIIRRSFHLLSHLNIKTLATIPGRVAGRKIRRNAKEIPAAWLEWNFAMAPFFSDMQSFANITNGYFDKQPIFQVKSTRKGLQYGPNPGDGAWWTCKVKAGGYLYMSNPNVGLVERLGVTDLLGAAWELVPWSWAVDYFTNVGEYIGNLDPLYHDVRLVDAYWSETKHLKRDLYTYFGNGEFGVQHADGCSFERKLISSIPSVTFEINNTLSLRRLSYAMSAVALTLSGKAKGYSFHI